jgi:hypothetical protein
MNRKLTAVVAALVGLTGLSGCADLDETIVSGVTSSYYESASGFEDAVRAAYSGLQDLYGQERNMTMLEMGTDVWTKGADGSHKHFNDYTPALNAAESYPREQWTNTYRDINITNEVIARAPNVVATASLTDELKATRVAEAKYLRAFYYFYLVRMYGDITVVTEPTEGVVTEATRTPAAQVYSDVIIPDLEAAIAGLPVSWGDSDYGRATKGAAQNLLGLVYLTRADAGDMTKAADLFKQVIDSGQYQLQPTYASVWDMANEKNSEVIFPVISTSDPLTFGQGNRWHLYWLMEYDIENGMKRTTEYGRPFKRLRMTEFTMHMHDREKDSRYETGWQFVWYVNKPDASKGLALGDTSIFFPSVTAAELDTATYCHKNYTVYVEPADFAHPHPGPIPNCPAVKSEYDYRAFPSLAKWQDPTRASTNQEEGQRDFPVYRLADTYLMLGEALYRDGKPDEAVQYFNIVRERAAKPGQNLDITVDSLTTGGIDFILNERARELFAEGHRWFDLVRTHKLVDRVKKWNYDAAPNIDEHFALRPIPQDQIDRTHNEDGTPYGQNPGY